MDKSITIEPGDVVRHIQALDHQPYELNYDREGTPALWFGPRDQRPEPGGYTPDEVTVNIAIPKWLSLQMDVASLTIENLEYGVATGTVRLGRPLPTHPGYCGELQGTITIEARRGANHFEARLVRVFFLWDAANRGGDAIRFVALQTEYSDAPAVVLV